MARMIHSNGATFPFAAIVGQDLMRLSLALNAINPSIGGVLIRGERGTAKSTAVRGLAAVLPEIKVATCTYGCAPGSLNVCEECRERRQNGTIEYTTRQVRVVDLPVSATEDRVIGTLDLEAALARGERKFEPGLLAAAHRGLLYVDEVNLLDDHLVDTLLDSAASGTNLIEREGVQFRHPSEYILVGTMNPEEGDLRPQLLDRFGLAAEIRGDTQPSHPGRDRAAADRVRRRSGGFPGRVDRGERGFAEADCRARELLPSVDVSPEMLSLIIHIAIAMGVDGHRADIVMHKTASTIAAWEGRTEVTRDDIRRAAELALPHRRRRDPFTPPHLDPDELDQAIQSFDASRQASGSDAAEAGMEKRQMSATGEETVAASDQNAGAPTQAGAERQIDPDSIPDSPTVAAHERLPMTRPRSGRRTQHEVQGRRGRSVRSRHMKPNDPPDVALLDTIRAAALRGIGDGTPNITQDDIRIRRRMRKVGNLMLFVVDGSGSMAAQRRMQLTKSAVLSLLADAYQRRDRVGLVTFRKTDAHETVPPTNSLDLAHARMRELPTGGRTPLAQGLDLARRVILRERARDAETKPIVILLTDGVANVGLEPGSDPIDDAMRAARRLALDRIPALVIDADRRRARLSPLPDLAKSMMAAHVRLDALASGELTSLIRLATA